MVTQPRPGLIPQTGDPAHPGRWVKPRKPATPDPLQDPRVTAGRREMEEMDKGGPPRPGLVPQSGDPLHPGRWVRPPESAGRPPAQGVPAQGAGLPPSEDQEMLQDRFLAEAQEGMVGGVTDALHTAASAMIASGNIDEGSFIDKLVGQVDIDALERQMRGKFGNAINREELEGEVEAQAEARLDDLMDEGFFEMSKAGRAMTHRLKGIQKGLTWCPTHRRWEGTTRDEPEGGRMDKDDVREPFAVATAQAQEMGFTDFSEGSPGRAERDKIAEALKMIKALERIACK